MDIRDYQKHYWCVTTYKNGVTKAIPEWDEGYHAAMYAMAALHGAMPRWSAHIRNQADIRQRMKKNGPSKAALETLSRLVDIKGSIMGEDLPALHVAQLSVCGLARWTDLGAYVLPTAKGKMLFKKNRM